MKLQLAAVAFHPHQALSRHWKMLSPVQILFMHALRAVSQMQPGRLAQVTSVRPLQVGATHSWLTEAQGRGQFGAV